MRNSKNDDARLVSECRSKFPERSPQTINSPSEHMKAFISIKYREDQQNRLCIEKISAALEQSGFETVCVTRDIEKWGQVEFSPETLMRKTFDEIDSSHLIVVDLTKKGVGLGIEAGYAHARGKPIVTIAKKGSDISTTLLGISQKLFLYHEFDELLHFFAQSGMAGFSGEPDAR